jgi:hypothetical protein
MWAKQLLEFKHLDLKSIRRPDLDALAESLSQDEITAEYVRFLSGKRAVTEQEEREAMELMISGDEQAKDTFLLYYMPLVVEIALRYTGAGPCLLDRVEEGNQTLVDIVEEEKVITPGEILERIHRRIFILVLRSHITGLVGKEPVEEYLPDLSFKMSEKEMEILKRLCSAEDYLEELLQTAVDYSVSPQRIATVWNRAQRIIRQSRRNRQRSLKDFLGNPENN